MAKEEEEQEQQEGQEEESEWRHEPGELWELYLKTYVHAKAGRWDDICNWFDDDGDDEVATAISVAVEDATCDNALRSFHDFFTEILCDFFTDKPGDDEDDDEDLDDEDNEDLDDEDND